LGINDTTKWNGANDCIVSGGVKIVNPGSLGIRRGSKRLNSKHAAGFIPNTVHARAWERVMVERENATRKIP
jgi:hypothetical protein